MALPEHKYYTLKQAAKKANCEVEDLIHFAANGKLELCIKVPDLDYTFSSLTEEGDVKENILFFSETYSQRKDFSGKLYNDEIANLETRIFGQPISLSDDGTRIITNADFSRFDYNNEYFSITEAIDNRDEDSLTTFIVDWYGLIAIPKEYIYNIEGTYSKENSSIININNFSIPRCPPLINNQDIDQEKETLLGGFYSNERIEVDINHTYITAYEFSLLLNGGLDIPDDLCFEHNDSQKKTPRRENFSRQKASLVRSLVELAFAEDGGISKLSMESISEQLQEKFKKNNIEYDDINPANIRNYLGKAKAR